MIPDEKENEQWNDLAVLLVVLREKAEPGPFPNRLGVIRVKAKEAKEINDRGDRAGEKESLGGLATCPVEQRTKHSAELFELLHCGCDFRTSRAASHKKRSRTSNRTRRESLLQQLLRLVPRSSRAFRLIEMIQIQAAVFQHRVGTPG